MTLSFECDDCGEHGSDLCGLAHTLACFVEFDLGAAFVNNNLLASEEGITHSLVRLAESWEGHGKPRFIEIPRDRESKNGADIQIDFTAQIDGRLAHRSWLVQCKRSSRFGDLEQLDHEVPRGSGKRQYEILLNAAASARVQQEAMYWLYGFSRSLASGMSGPAADCSESILVVPAKTVQVLGQKPQLVSRHNLCARTGVAGHANGRWKSWETMTHASCHQAGLIPARSLTDYLCEMPSKLHRAIQTEPMGNRIVNDSQRLPSYLRGAGLEPPEANVNYLLHFDLSDHPVFS